MLEKLSETKVVPVAVLPDVDNGLKACEALLAGGLPVIEITFRTAAAESLIKAVHKEFPEMLIGAGTILNCDDLMRAVDAGARFAVAPGTNPQVLEKALAIDDFDFFPGVCTPTDVEKALQLGARTLKFFPAEAAGGVAMLKALIGPYGHTGVKFCPTGGINYDNMLDYLKLPEVLAVGGSWMISKDLLGDWAKISELSKQAVMAAKQN